MKFGFVFPAADPLQAVEYALAAEAMGWDGFFMFETVWGTDPWVTLANIAARTERIRLGTMLTPLPVLSPWKLAAETATLDALSNGRVILSVGLGAPDTGFGNFGLPTDRRTRAERLDEGLEIINGLWRGQPFNFKGQHYTIQETTFTSPPPPVQQKDGLPHIPIWVVGAWLREKSMQRAIRYDGLLPNVMDASGHRPITPDDVRAMSAWVAATRTELTPFDIVVEGQTWGDDLAKQAEIIGAFARAGATWWIEAMWEKPLEEVLSKLKQGPPSV